MGERKASGMKQPTDAAVYLYDPVISSRISVTIPLRLLIAPVVCLPTITLSLPPQPEST